MKKFLENPGPLSFGKLLLKPGMQDVDEAAFEHALARSKYLRTMVAKGRIRDTEEPKYELEEMSWQDATELVEKTTDAGVLARWLEQEKARSKPRKSVVEAIEDQLKTLES